MAKVEYQPGGLIAGDFPQMQRTVTILTGATLVRGTVLGRITASDKYTTSLAASRPTAPLRAAAERSVELDKIL